MIALPGQRACRSRSAQFTPFTPRYDDGCAMISKKQEPLRALTQDRWSAQESMTGDEGA